MDKPKFTLLQEEILRFLYSHADKEFNKRNLAKMLRVSSTAIAKSLKKLVSENFIIKSKNTSTKIISIKLNRDNPKTIQLKRADNLKNIYLSGLFDYLDSNFLKSTIILFGSYSFGYDTSTSDIDIAIIGKKEKKLEVENFEKLLGKKINIQFYSNLREIGKELRENLCNGIILQGGIEL